MYDLKGLYFSFENTYRKAFSLQSSLPIFKFLSLFPLIHRGGQRQNLSWYNDGHHAASTLGKIFNFWTVLHNKNLPCVFLIESCKASKLHADLEPLAFSMETQLIHFLKAMFLPPNTTYLLQPMDLLVTGALGSLPRKTTEKT